MKGDVKPLLEYLDKWTPESRSLFKKIYNDLNDQGVSFIEDIKVTEEEFNKLLELVNKVNQGIDITKDIGHRYFRGLKIQFADGVFIPQYDTEQIIDLVKDNLNEGSFIEIGTGTGAIPLSIVNETELAGISLDINPVAINIASHNADINNINKSKLIFKNENAFNFNPDNKFNLIISNPPYIKDGDNDVDQWVKDNQPKEALYAEDDGLSFYKLIASKVKEWLIPDGYVIVEIGHNQGKDVTEIFSSFSTEISITKDYEGHDRFVVAKYNK